MVVTLARSQAQTRWQCRETLPDFTLIGSVPTMVHRFPTFSHQTIFARQACETRDSG